MYNRLQSRVKTVTIAIPSLHRPDLTARCIEFIQRQTLAADSWEIVVIENEARPEAILPDPLPRNTQRLELNDNEGTTGSINRAVLGTTSRYVLLLNNDVELQPDYLAILVHALDGDSTLGFCNRQAVTRNPALPLGRCRRRDARGWSGLPAGTPRRR